MVVCHIEEVRCKGLIVVRMIAGRVGRTEVDFRQIEIGVWRGGGCRGRCVVSDQAWSRHEH